MTFAKSFLLPVIALTTLSSSPLFAQQVTENQLLTYADIADLALPAPIAAGVEIRKATRLKGELAGNVPAGKARFLIEADVRTLIRGAQGLPARTSYLVDVPLDAANRPPKLRKARMLVLAALVPNRPGELRLIAPDAQVGWTADSEARLRAILTAAVAPDAPPRVTGVGNAFHVPGSLPGESETGDHELPAASGGIEGDAPDPDAPAGDDPCLCDVPPLAGEAETPDRELPAAAGGIAP